MFGIPINDKFRIKIPKSNIVVLALMAIAGLALWWGDHYLSPEVHQAESAATISRKSRLFSLYGVVFKIEDRETLVFPVAFLSSEQMNEAVPKIAGFSLCAHLPEMGFYGDRQSLAECTGVGISQSQQAASVFFASEVRLQRSLAVMCPRARPNGNPTKGTRIFGGFGIKTQWSRCGRCVPIYKASY